MKRTILIFFLLFYGSFVFAQNAAVKIRVVDGAEIRSSNDVVESADSLAELGTFVTALKTAGLTDTFKYTNPITVFAPANSAFAKLPAGALDSLLLAPGHLAELKNLLLYHAIAGMVTSKDIARQISLGNGRAVYTTLSGDTLIATINANRNIVLTDENGGQSIISRFDISQSNGILDIITAVLVPKNKLWQTNFYMTNHLP